MKNKINRDDFVRRIAQKLDKPIKEVREFEETLEAVLIEAWEKEETIALYGFGEFNLRVLEERPCKNPRTGEPMKASRTIIPKFKVGKTLKDKLNK